jgi:Rps23 Pro-64 3,4-dihydroxylase Tpa1-like proline 4-hydroxylase
MNFTNPLSDRFIFDDPRYAELALSSAERYQRGDPFPSIHFDDFLPQDVADAVWREFPSASQIAWNDLQRPSETKLLCANEQDFGPVTRQLMYQFHSNAFVRFLEKVTGIDNLIPDPSMIGGGLHQTLRGGLLKLHADFNLHNTLKLDRRVNILLYMNKDWQEEWGGHLELWDQDCKRCGTKIAPTFNRLGIFSTTSVSFHGHPDPLNCPPDNSRKSIALYYYTNGRQKTPEAEAHTTIFKARPGESIGGLPLHRIQDFVPPVLWRGLRKWRETAQFKGQAKS